MTSRKPSSRQDVERILALAVEALHPVHRKLFEEIRVTPVPIQVTDTPGEYVFAVAQQNGKLIYWSDLEEGWEIEASNPSGEIDSRGANQFELHQVTYQIFGDPEAP